MAKITLNLRINQDKKEINNFYNEQARIKQYLESIISVIEQYPDTPEKEMLLERLNEIKNNISLNTLSNLEDPIGSILMDLDIKEDEKYLIFSLYIFEENGYVNIETPTIVIISKEQKKIYFIEELYYIFDEDSEEYIDDFDPVIKGLDDISYFEINNDSIIEFHMTQEEETDILFDNAFNDTFIFTQTIEEDSRQKTYPKPPKKSLKP